MTTLMSESQHPLHDVISHGGALDTLYRLAVYGSAESGDLPSKMGFSLLEHHGLARRNTTTWIACITDAGLNLFKELTWRNGQVTGKEILDNQKTPKPAIDGSTHFHDTIQECQHTAQVIKEIHTVGGMDTLYDLVVTGPRARKEPRDLNVRDPLRGVELMELHGLVIKDPTTMEWSVTNAGIDFFKKLSWQGGKYSGKEILEALERAWKEDSGVRVVEHQTVRGDSVATLVGKK